jgi:hypothetical protein
VSNTNCHTKREVPYLMHADALQIKRMAEDAFDKGVGVGVSAAALLSLIEQAHSAQLGLATTKELRAELAARDGCPISSQDDYRTFDPLSETDSSSNEENRT